MTRILIICLGLAFMSSSVGAYDVYYGSFHSHTAYSDGIGTVAQAYTCARDTAHIDVLAITDHTHMLTATEWNNTMAAAEAFTEDGVFVALCAQEFGNLNDFGHIGILFTPVRNPNSTSNLPATYNFIQSYNGVGNFCHPSSSYGSWFDNFYYYSSYGDAMHSLEIRNGLRVDDYEPEFIYALNKGWKLGPFANQDNHEGEWGMQQNPNDGGAIYLTGTLLDNLTYDDVYNALRNRHFFAMEEDPPGDRIKMWYWVNDSIMGSVIESEGPVDFTAHVEAANGTSLFNRIDLFEDGVIINSQVLIGTTIDYAHSVTIANEESHYYFIRARQVDGDYAWSSPVWVQHTPSSGLADPLEGVNAHGVELLPNTPNPFSPRTQIRYESDGVMAGPIGMTIHDVTGRRVRDLG
ncbi:MAG: hypothetical protein KJ831_07310, partial [Candidatus Eisenbacteria bacterium]|nr:hypothetical protein [Candidatus Eisenbacteria bacterium]